MYLWWVISIIRHVTYEFTHDSEGGRNHRDNYHGF